MFARDRSLGLVTAHRDVAATIGDWSAWTSHGSVVLSDPRSIGSASRSDVFARGRDGGGYQKVFDTSVRPSRSTWFGLAIQPRGPIAITSRQAGQYDLFFTGQDHGVYTMWGNGDEWSPQGTGAFFLGGDMTGCPIAINVGPDLALFSCGADGILKFKHWNQALGWQPSNEGWLSLDMRVG